MPDEPPQEQVRSRANPLSGCADAQGKRRRSSSSEILGDYARRNPAEQGVAEQARRRRACPSQALPPSPDSSRHGTARHQGSGGGDGHFRGNHQDAPAPGARFPSQRAGRLCPACAAAGEERPCLTGIASRSSPCSLSIWMVSSP